MAKLNSSGALQWNKFFGTTREDSAYGVKRDAAGNLYVAGQSIPYSYDGVVWKLSPSGDLVWTSFVGGACADASYEVALDPADPGSVYVVGMGGGCY